MERTSHVEWAEFLFFFTEILAIRMNSAKIWLAIAWIIFSPVCRDLSNGRPGPRHNLTGLV